MIVREDREDIAVLRIEHGKVNAIDLELLESVHGEIAALREQRPRGVVLTGTGKNFSAGLDLVRVLEEDATYLERLLPALHEALLGLFTLPRPVIAAVNGHAIAGGFVLACACDFRIVADGSTKLGITELPVGVPFPTAPLEMVRTVVGSRRTRELVYSGRLVSAAEALELGFASEVVEPERLLERAVAVAGRCGAVPAHAFELTKRQLQAPTLDRLRRHQDTFGADVARIWGDPHVQAAIRAFVAKTLRR